MALSPEDALRLNVLLANKPLAIRLNESTMILHGLGKGSEAVIKLNPNCRDDRYVRHVREALSGHVLGSPGGYPVYLQRWTRMGQMRDNNLEQLLLLGEPEAVMAVVCAPGITNELARRAWWAYEDSENARRMLARPAVAQGDMGPVLADYLVEHLPFDTEPEPMMDSVALALQPGLVAPEVKEDLWKKAGRKTAYYVGFLMACPDDLPGESVPNPLFEQLFDALSSEQARDALADLYLHVLSPKGQLFLRTVDKVLDKPPNQDVVTRALDLVANWFSAARPEGSVDLTLQQLQAEADLWTNGILEKPNWRKYTFDDDRKVLDHLGALRVLSGLSYGVIRSAIGDSTAIGSLMRRKLAPVLTPLKEKIRSLRE